METELKSWENVSEWITLVNKRFIELYNEKIISSSTYPEDESILGAYEVYIAREMQKLIPSLIVIMFQNGTYGYLYKSIVLDFYGNPTYEQKYTIIPDMDFELLLGEIIGTCDPLRNQVWNTLEKEILMDEKILLEMVKHHQEQRQRIMRKERI